MHGLILFRYTYIQLSNQLTVHSQMMMRGKRIADFSGNLSAGKWEVEIEEETGLLYALDSMQADG